MISHNSCPPGLRYLKKVLKFFFQIIHLVLLLKRTCRRATRGQRGQGPPSLIKEGGGKKSSTEVHIVPKIANVLIISI